MPVTVYFLGYEHVHVFTNWVFSWLYLFLSQTKKIKSKSPLSLEMEKTFSCTIFDKKIVMLPSQSVALANWFACVSACMSWIAQISQASLDNDFFCGKVDQRKWGLSLHFQLRLLLETFTIASTWCATRSNQFEPV